MKRKIINLILLFFSGAVIGWLWEVLENLVANHMFTNRGFLHGPWLPIYGAGMVLIYFLKKYCGQNPVILFVVGCIAFGVIEYVASWAMELIYHARWWDYTYEFMNLNGRICLKYVVLFSVAGCFAAYLLLPFLMRIFSHIPNKIATCICVILIVLFIVDGAVSLGKPNTGNQISNPVIKLLF